MGTVYHHAIIVTAHADDGAKAARDKAIQIGCIVTPISEAAVNGYKTFLICPDGSKEGWSDSDYGDRLRDRWVEYANGLVKDGDSSLEWVEVKYGADAEGASIVRQSRLTRI